MPCVARTARDDPLLIQQQVKWSLSNNVPFVPKSGGHSQFSTVGSDGVVLDLSPMGAVVLDEKSETATLCGGVLEKEVAVALAAAERWTRMCLLAI